MKVRIYWRRRHITDERLHALRSVLAEYPGDDEVLVAVTGTGEIVRLPVTVDGAARQLRLKINRATGACAIVEGLEPAF